jgi:hypothetical protein
MLPEEQNVLYKEHQIFSERAPATYETLTDSLNGQILEKKLEKMF